MTLKNILEKMNVLKKQTISTKQPLDALEVPSYCINAVKATQKGTSNEEAQHATALDAQHYINEYARLAFAFSDRVLEELEPNSQDPYWRAQIEKILAQREALQRALAYYNAQCEEKTKF
jgi:hypothetical protein